jgi:hypothetical protein
MMEGSLKVTILDRIPALIQMITALNYVSAEYSTLPLLCVISPGGEAFDRSDILLAGGVVQSIEKSVYFAVISENLHKDFKHYWNPMASLAMSLSYN